MAIKLTKNEQKVQKDHLKQYQRYLPTLQLLLLIWAVSQL